MSILTRIDHHEKLMSRMADRNGADLDLALQTGMVSPGELQDAVLTCTGCTEPEACEARLDSGETGLPGYCRNADLITSIAGLIDSAD
jgi:hypothetical protein